MPPRRTPTTSADPTPSSPGGLQLPRSVGISSKDLEEIATKFNTLEEVEAEIASKGLTPRERPAFELPDITPELLTTPDAQQYSVFYAQHLAWRNYIMPQLASASSLLSQAKTQLKLVEQKMRADLQRTNNMLEKKDRLSAAEIETEIETDPTRIEILLVVQKAQQSKATLDAYFEIADKNLAVISRQVEIRKLDIEKNLRGENFGYGPRPITR